MAGRTHRNHTGPQTMHSINDMTKSTKTKFNRRQAIRACCLDCSGGSRREVRKCPFTDCPLWPFRIGTGKQDPRARNKAIRAYCLWCVNEQRMEIRLCPSGGCPLYPFRPYQKTGENVRTRQIEAISQKKKTIEGTR